MLTCSFGVDPFSDTSISKDVVERAVACALEINKNLSDYKIVFVPSVTVNIDSESSHIDHPNAEEVAYLNVHAGLSVGMMAGLDVGANDRWEFMLVGSPLGEVANAEECAKKGELIISEGAHCTLHPVDHISSIPQCEVCSEVDPKQSSTTNTVLACGCEIRKEGCYLVNKDLPIKTPKRPEGRRTSLFDVNTAYTKRTCQTLLDHFIDAFEVWRSVIQDSTPELEVDATLTTQDLKSELMKIIKNDSVSTNFSVSLTATMFDHFRSWVFNTLTATLAAHVHQTTRDGYDFTTLRHLMTFNQLVHSRHKSIASPTHIETRRKTRGSSQESMRLGGSISAPTHMETDLTAELRNVIVLFIKIDINFGDWQKNQLSNFASDKTAKSPIKAPTMDLSLGGIMSTLGGFMSPTVSSSKTSAKEKDINRVRVPKFNFLHRSQQELACDHSLLQKFQKCMDILTTNFMEKGGQLRQFIVDDKGTVCIGTFGLRGAVNYDDAAAAIEAAKSIIVQLRDAKMEAGIGITSGKAYCGLVGSPTRHEYAVMGPSVNLSARLMSKAKYLQILCDDETKLRDRVHAFSDLGEIQAKGYAKPVRIYSPILNELGGVFGPTFTAPNSPSPSVSNLLGSPATSSESTDKGVLTRTPSTLAAGSTATNSNRRRRRVRNSFLSEHLRSSFNMNSESNVNLYGRKAEIDTLLRHLLKKVTTSNASLLKSFSHTPNSSPRLTNSVSMPAMDLPAPTSSTNGSPQHLSLPGDLDLHSHALFVCIAGVCGVGKTVFLNEICRVISKVNDSNLKVAAFRKRISSYSSSEPFHAWRSIFREMMGTLFRLEAAEANKSCADVAPVDRVLQGVKLMEAAMTEGGDIMSLLSSINFLPIESENASEIESLGPLSLLRSVDMLAKIIQTFITKTKHLVTIAL
jgi:class 3 adenylate cyclase